MTNIQNNNEYLSGIVERITYHNPTNGFCVLRIKVKNYKDLVTITGNIPSITVGEYIKCSGMWYNDRNYGQQFKATFIKALPPSSIEGITKYLGSGLIKGIGSYCAEKLVNTFGEKVFEVIEQKPHLLSTVAGIGKVRADSICKNWHEQKVVREIMVFLQSHGISTSKSTRIYKTYGEKAIEIVSENPYKLAQDIRGIGFISADVLAKNIGIAENSIIRARAGIKHVLLEATSAGHCGLPQDTLIQKAGQLLGINLDLIIEAINMESAAGLIIQDTIANNNIVFLKSYYIYEKYISNTLLALNKQPVAWNEINYQQVIASVEDKLNISLEENQKQALIQALHCRVMVITGGPGTGKTTLINILLTVLQAQTQNLIIKLCAPTGRAAKRLAETTKLEAVTIHRLLAIDPNYGSSRYNKENLLQCDYLIIDEMSMVDVSLFYSLLQALPQNISLILVGDVDQLPSIGAGQVLRDIINSNVITTIKLTQIFRQAASSHIIQNAHKINQGQMPDLLPDQTSDFFFINAEPGTDLITKIINLLKERIPQKFGFNSINDIQILAPMQRGNSGVRILNIEIQKALNPTYEAGIFKFGQYFAINDKVMQIENNYTKEVYNGDIGIIKNIDNIEQEVIITFDKRDIIYDYNDLDQITLAYAITIHKSQGSEYPAVIIPITMQSYIMLKRNLLYTAISRGKQLVILLGQKKAIAIAAQDKTYISRYSKLKEWLISCYN